MNDQDSRKLVELQVEVKHLVAGVERIASSLERSLDKQDKRIDGHEARLAAIEQRSNTQAAVVGAAVNTSKAWYGALVVIATLAWPVVQFALHKLGVVL